MKSLIVLSCGLRKQYHFIKFGCSCFFLIVPNIFFIIIMSRFLKCPFQTLRILCKSLKIGEEREIWLTHLLRVVCLSS